MPVSRQGRALTIALYLNAALLALIALGLWRGAGPDPSSLAWAQVPQPIAGGAGLFLMPAQFSQTTWGCYVMDVDAQTLCAYQYVPGERQLKLVAARGFRFDRRLSNFNTFPAPSEVADLVERERQGVRTENSEFVPPSPEATPPGQ